MILVQPTTFLLASSSKSNYELSNEKSIGIHSLKFASKLFRYKCMLAINLIMSGCVLWLWNLTHLACTCTRHVLYRTCYCYPVYFMLHMLYCNKELVLACIGQTRRTSLLHDWGHVGGAHAVHGGGGHGRGGVAAGGGGRHVLLLRRGHLGLLNGRHVVAGCGQSGILKMTYSRLKLITLLWGLQYC